MPCYFTGSAQNDLFPLIVEASCSRWVFFFFFPPWLCFQKGMRLFALSYFICKLLFLTWKYFCLSPNSLKRNVGWVTNEMDCCRYVRLRLSQDFDINFYVCNHDSHSTLSEFTEQRHCFRRRNFNFEHKTTETISDQTSLCVNSPVCSILHCVQHVFWICRTVLMPQWVSGCLVFNNWNFLCYQV